MNDNPPARLLASARTQKHRRENQCPRPPYLIQSNPPSTEDEP
jgi:hypothetical protein